MHYYYNFVFFNTFFFTRIHLDHSEVDNPSGYLKNQLQ